jgi:hypothetical protein
VKLHIFLENTLGPTKLTHIGIFGMKKYYAPSGNPGQDGSTDRAATMKTKKQLVRFVMKVVL